MKKLFKIGLSLALLAVLVLPASFLGYLALSNSKIVSVEVAKASESMGQLRSSADESTGRIRKAFEDKTKADYEFIAQQLGGSVEIWYGYLSRVQESLAASTILESYMSANEGARRVIEGQLGVLFRNTIVNYGLAEVAVLTPEGLELERETMEVVPPGGDPDLDAEPLPNRTKDESHSPWFVAAVAEQKAFIRSFVYFETDFSVDRPVPVLSLTCPLRYKGARYSPSQGTMQGYLRISIPVSVFCKALGSKTAEFTGTVFLTDNAGRIVLDDDQGKIGTVFQGDAGVSEKYYVFRRGISAGLLRLYVLASRADIEKSSSVARSLASAVQTRVLESTKISEQIQAMSLALRRRMIMVTVLSLLAASVVVLLLARRITVPLGKVCAAATRIAGGDVGVDIERLRRVKSFSEIRQLGEAMGTVCLTIRKLVSELGNVTRGIAEGDLTKLVEGGYSGEFATIKNALNAVIMDMRKWVTAIRGHAESIAGSATQLIDISTQLSTGAREQATALERIAASAAQIGQQTQGNARNAVETNEIAVGAHRSAEGGNAQMQDLSRVMTEILDAAQRVARITAEIQEVASKTRLLGLNAAIEASRAGAQGTAFGVVAKEVSTLAVRTTTAAKETSILVQEAVSKAANGMELAIKMSESLNEIREGAVKTSTLVGRIAEDSRQQAESISEIDSGLQNIDGVMKQITVTAEETAATAEELAAHSEQLERMLSGFILEPRLNYNDERPMENTN